MDPQEKELQAASSAQAGLGLYCHVPFCASTCDFCAFYQEKPHRRDLNRYLDCMKLEFESLPSDQTVDTVFWGGGTPGLLAAKDLEVLGTAMLEHLVQTPIEWTIEMAPSTVKVDKLAVLKDLGVTRISMGVQSFDAQLLESLGRLHRPGQIYKAWERIQAANFAQTNLDLMFALPNQTIEQWESTIREAARLAPSHLSTYCLTFEEDTALYIKLAKGVLHRDEERELLFYERGWEVLDDLGYKQYEISNFSKPGAECLHNINTWKMTEWIGCGPSAASQYAGFRYKRPANLNEWASTLESGAYPKEEEFKLDNTILMADALVFGLRMNMGIDLNAIAKRFGQSIIPAQWIRLFNRLEAEGLIAEEEGHIALTHQGRLVADAIGSAILENA